LGTTVLLTTQYLEEADQLADQIAVIDKGGIIAEGTPNELKASIGKKTLTFRLTKHVELEKISSILDDHASNVYQDEDPLVFKVPVKEAKLANDAIHTLLVNEIPVEDFVLGKPSLDEVFLALTASKHREVV
jgi:ABC-2 type transport system ATP-binding protein